MKQKLLSLFLIAFIFPALLLSQSETYTVSLTPFSSKKYDEFSPVYYGAGIVFCSNKSYGLVSNYQTPDNKGLFKINYAELLSKKTSLFSKELTTRFNDGPASFSKNFDTVYFSRNIVVDGPVNENENPRNKLGIFMAFRENGEWAKITDLRFNNEYYNITTPCISPDGRRLFFASDNPAGHGGSDLYYCEWKGDYWDEPVNLGQEINTTGNESYPFVDREGALFFSSDGLPGMGGKDIFYTRQSEGKWLPPVRLDAPINSISDDFGLVADSVMNGGYFSSNRNKSIDIFSFRTIIRQLYYCTDEKVNQYCYKFSDEDKIRIDERYLQLVWDFGDGTKVKGITAEHCYKGPGRYNVRLDAVDIKTGQVFFTKLSYVLELNDIEQPLINIPAAAVAGEAVSFDGLGSNFPGSEILSYTWYFGDGGRTTGEKGSHTFRERGDYEVKLGVVVRDGKNGVIRNKCVVQPVKVFTSHADKGNYDKRVIPPTAAADVFSSGQVDLTGLRSAEKDFNPETVFLLEAVTSKMKLNSDNKLLAGIPGYYNIREIYLPGEGIYSYVVAEELSLMSVWPAFNEIRNLGFTNSRIRTELPEDPAEKELNNLKRVFGVSTDLFFGRNNFALTGTGTQLLDQVLGFLVKYPSIKLEIATHTDNIGSAPANQTLSQRRAEAMVSYLVSNGINPRVLVSKGYGESRPVASNMIEADRKLNRRVDFRIIR